MKLTKSQGKEIFNQHIGTGYMIILTSDNTYSIIDIQERGNKWYAGLNGCPLNTRLDEIAKEIEAQHD